MKNNYPRIVISRETHQRMIEIARQFRKEPTKGGKILWDALRAQKLDGVKFCRQQPVGYFAVDFYASAFRLVAEVDGSIHKQQIEADEDRQNLLEELGLHVLRIKIEMIERNLPLALTLIRGKIEELKQALVVPSPHVGERKGGG